MGSCGRRESVCAWNVEEEDVVRACEHTHVQVYVWVGV